MKVSNRFAELRDQVVALLQRSADVMEHVVPHLGDDGRRVLPQTFRERANKVREEEFVVVVVGEMNRGKSMLLNAMMHRRLLPMDVLECTATVNFLRYPNLEAGQASDQAHVYFTDGRPAEQVSVEKLPDYTSRLSTDGKDMVANSVDHVDAFVESPFLREQVLLVDTPGANTTTANHIRITHEQIDRSNAAIFLLNAETQVTRSDREFLGVVEDAVARLFFVVNKIDRVPESQITRVLDDVEQKVKNAVSDGSKLRKRPVFGISALKAFLGRCGYVQNQVVDRNRWSGPRVPEALLEESRITTFEDDLQRYLFGGGKGRDLLLNPLSVIRDETDRAMSDLKRQVDLLDERFDVSDLELQIVKMERAVDERKHALAGATEELADELTNVLSDVEGALEEKCKLEEEDFQDQLNAYDSVETLKQDWSDGLHIEALRDRKAVGLARYAEKSIKDAIERVLRKASREVRKQISDELGDLSVELPKFPDLNLRVQEAESQSAEADNLKQNIEDSDRRLRELERTAGGKHKREYSDLLGELQRQKEDYHFECQQLGSLPEIRITHRPTVEREWGEGLFGWGKTILFGRLEKEGMEEVKDDQERREYEQKLDDFRKQHRKKVADIERRVEDARDKYNVEMIEKRRGETLEKVRVNYQEALEKEESRQREALVKKRARAVEVTRNRLVSAFRDATDNLKNAVRDTIGRTRNMAVDFIDEVSQALDEGLKTNRQQLAKLQALKGQKEGEREESRRGIDEALQDLRALHGEASDLVKEHTVFIAETRDADGGESGRG